MSKDEIFAWYFKVILSEIIIPLKTTLTAENSGDIFIKPGEHLIGLIGSNLLTKMR